MKKHHLRLEEQSRRWREEAAQKEFEKQQKINEENRLLLLAQDASSWVKSKQIKEYVSCIKLNIDDSQLSPEKKEAYLKWEDCGSG